MLIKVGDFWVDPTKVVGITKFEGEDGRLHFDDKSVYLPGLTDEKMEEYAKIINDYVATQSFGGEDDSQSSNG